MHSSAGAERTPEGYAGWENEKKEEGRALMEKVFVGSLFSSFWKESALYGYFVHLFDTV